MLDINSTLLIQIVNFLVLLFVLNIILYRPIRRVLAQRAQEMETGEKTIEELQEKAHQSEKDIEEGIVLARKEGYSQKEALKSEGLKEEKKILEEAGAGVEKKLDAAKKEMEAKMAATRKALEEEIGGFSQELAQKILGRSVQ